MTKQLCRNFAENSTLYSLYNISISVATIFLLISILLYSLCFVLVNTLSFWFRFFRFFFILNLLKTQRINLSYENMNQMYLILIKTEQTQIRCNKIKDNMNYTKNIRFAILLHETEKNKMIIEKKNTEETSDSRKRAKHSSSSSERDMLSNGEDRSSGDDG